MYIYVILIVNFLHSSFLPKRSFLLTEELPYDLIT